MVELIRTKKGLDYPDHLLQRIRAFNNQLVINHGGAAVDAMKVFSDSRLIRCDVLDPSANEQRQFDDLCTEIQACHDAMCQAA